MPGELVVTMSCNLHEQSRVFSLDNFGGEMPPLLMIRQSHWLACLFKQIIHRV